MKDSKVRVCLAAYVTGLFLVLGTGGVVQAQIKHRPTLDDLGTLRYAGYLQLSHDGSMLAYTVQGDDDIWVVATRPGNQPRKLVKGTIPLWSPDGKRLAYYSTESGALQLWVLDIASDRKEQLTQLPGGIDPDPWTRITGSINDPLSYSWSPDSAKLVFASQAIAGDPSSRDTPISGITSPARGANVPLILTTNTPPEWTLSGVFSRGFDGFLLPPWKKGDSNTDEIRRLPPAKASQLFVVDTKTRVIAQLTRDHGLYFNPDWSPDGGKIVCASSEGRSLAGRGSGTTNIYQIDVGSGKKLALTSGAGDKRLPQWSSDGRWIAFLGGKHFGKQSVFVIPSNGGDAVNSTSQLDRSVEEFHWFSNSRSILVSYRDGVVWPIARVDTHTGTFALLTQDDAGAQIPTTLAQADVLAWQRDEPNSVVIMVLFPGDQRPHVLLDLNPQTQDWELGKQEIVRWRNSRGDKLEGILIKPVQYHEGRRYPLIVDGYPDQGNWLMANSMMSNQAWASMGYAIFYPNPRTPHAWMNPFKSEAYDQAAKGPKGWDVTVDDVISGVDQLISRGIVDSDQMALRGFSNGGAVVNFLVTRTSRFKCAVSVAGVYADWVRPVFLESDRGVPHFAGGISPWHDPDAYIQLSAVFHLDKVTTPMLLADGDEDGSFLLDSIEMYNGLRWFGKDVTLLRYPGQGHGFTGAALRDFWERENAFFDKYLKPAQPPK